MTTNNNYFKYFFWFIEPIKTAVFAITDITLSNGYLDET